MIWYYWLAILAIPPLFLFSIVCLDFKGLLKSWISHRWDGDEFGWLREFFCPKDAAGDPTWNGKCKAPANGGILYDNVDEWCKGEYDGSTDCAVLRREAEKAFLVYMSLMMNLNGIIGVADMALIFFSLKLVERTLTLPVIMSSMLDAINYLLLLPCLVCSAIGVFLQEHESLEVGDFWLKELFFAGSGGLLILACIGIFASREKLRGLLIAYTVGMVAVAAVLGTATASSFVYSISIGEEYGVKGQGKAGQVACDSGLFGCCCCDLENKKVEVDGVWESVSDEELCPEWSREEILQFIQADFKIAGLAGAISFVFALRAVRSSIILIKNLVDYKCVYI